MEEEKSKEQKEIEGLKTRLSEPEESNANLEPVEKRLKEIQERYKILVGTFPDIIYELDAEGRFTFISNSIEELGYSPQELLGKHFRQIVHPDDVEMVSREIVLPKYRGRVTGDAGSPKLFDERRTGKRMTKYLEVRLKVKAKPGQVQSYRYVELHSSGRWDKDVNQEEKKFLGSIGIIRDVSERKRMQEELQKLNQLKSEFISNVSHELRTPLSIINEAVSLVLDEIPGKIVKEQREMLNIAKSNISRLAKIIDSLLDISKIEAGKLELQMRFVNLARILQETVADFRYVAKDKNISLTSEVSDEVIELWSDGDKIRQVLVNLISNAIKFTPQGGSVIVGCEDREQEVIFYVKDTGRGISESDMPRLFDKFTQFGRKPGPGEKGTGLGLAISKGIVEMHKGKIWAESKLNQGSKFYFALPKLSAQEVFREFLLREIKQFLKPGSLLSVVVIRIANFEELLKEQPQLAADFLAGIENLLRETLWRSTDVILKFEREIPVILLPHTDREGAEAVVERVRERLKEYISAWEEIREKIDFGIKAVSFPEEAKNECDILERLKEGD